MTAKALFSLLARSVGLSATRQASSIVAIARYKLWFLVQIGFMANLLRMRMLRGNGQKVAGGKASAFFLGTVQMRHILPMRFRPPVSARRRPALIES